MCQPSGKWTALPQSCTIIGDNIVNNPLRIAKPSTIITEMSYDFNSNDGLRPERGDPQCSRWFISQIRSFWEFCRAFELISRDSEYFWANLLQIQHHRSLRSRALTHRNDQNQLWIIIRHMISGIAHEIQTLAPGFICEIARKSWRMIGFWKFGFLGPGWCYRWSIPANKYLLPRSPARRFQNCNRITTDR